MSLGAPDTSQHTSIRRNGNDGEPLTAFQRLRRRIKEALSSSSPEEDVFENGDEEAVGGSSPKSQRRRLYAKRRQANPQRPANGWRDVFNKCFSSSTKRVSLTDGVYPHQRIAMYLHWMFRVNFFFLFVVMCVAFFALVIVFAGFITIAGTLDEQCVRVGSEDFAYWGAPFADAFALSWTTISTVGYGSAYPALGYQNSSRTNCFFINFICSLEALIGVLYSGFCGAILFGKVLRIQSHAQVIFSDPLLIRYGSGIENPEPHDIAGSSDDENAFIPLPVLEFRIVNRLFNEVGGEIMDAVLNVVANNNAATADMNDANDDISNASHSQRYSDANFDPQNLSINSTHSSRSYDSVGRKIPSELGGGGCYFSRREGQLVDEDPTAILVNKHIFSKMEIEASEHPFFRRVWVARHVLDADSPILKRKIRRQLRRNGGRWPKELNNAEAIRNNLQFNQILVSLTGVSNISACDVYAQKIYDFVDVNIGYQFVNILYRNSDGSLGVDIDLLNDVREQNGGGGEPLIVS